MKLHRKAVPRRAVDKKKSPSAFTALYLDMDLSASVSPSVGALFAGLPSLSIVSMVVSCRFVRVAAARKPNTERRHDVRAASTGVAFAAVEKESRLWIADELGRYFVMRFYLWCEI